MRNVWIDCRRRRSSTVYININKTRATITKTRNQPSKAAVPYRFYTTDAPRKRVSKWVPALDQAILNETGAPKIRNIGS